MKSTLVILLALLSHGLAANTGSAKDCPAAPKYGSGPPKSCKLPTDPNNRPKSKLESWFTKEMFADLFPHANIGWGPNPCYPYSYESFVIAARYFPSFGTSSPNKEYSAEENYRRDLAAFFAHAIQETGENDYGLYQGGSKMTKEQARNCFYRGGFFNWFEGGPTSGFLPPNAPGHQPSDGDKCNTGGVYCSADATTEYFYPCSKGKSGSFFTGCYFGRGAIQISYNYNYGAFQQWLKEQNIHLDILKQPNLVMTHMNPPLAIMASLWFYMTPQPPKPAMHDIVMGQWGAGQQNEQAGYKGPIFGPTSLVINNECGGLSADEPGGGGENRRIRAFKWFCDYFKVPAGPDRLLSCKDMPVKFSAMKYPLSYQPDWSSTWKEAPCNCVPANYGGLIPYFDPANYPKNWVEKNEYYRKECVRTIYANPGLYHLENTTSVCLNHPPKGEIGTPAPKPKTTKTTPQPSKVTQPPPKKTPPPPPPKKTRPPVATKAPPKVTKEPRAGGVNTGSAKDCPAAPKYGSGPPKSCKLPTDPNNRPKSKLESWFTKEMFADLFPHANIGWGPNPCYPYSYESFVIAARYFPSFGTSSPNKEYSAEENYRRDLAAFFAHAIQETGENDYGLYHKMTKEQARNCFYRGGFFNWFEGGPTSGFLPPNAPGHQPSDGDKCNTGGVYCSADATTEYFYPCSKGKSGSFFTGCYFGRGAIQISYNYNYGAFQQWLKEQNIHLDILKQPNLVMTHMNPPLAIMASLWFYMTPQPPKPAMHDIVMGQWGAGQQNEQAGYKGPIFGPTSLVINNECGGLSADEPGGGGENRRIRAFKWFCDYFKVPAGPDRLLSCKDMPVKFSAMKYPLSYQPDWSSTWKEAPCNCVPANYGGLIPYFDPANYPKNWVEKNEYYRKECVRTIYANPGLYHLSPQNSACLNHPPPKM
ncbi:hypothetical protein QR680_018601 [Steinernema hermaphroditum]|uniref:Glycoside hydrolase family 19 catalytic domain-containing protein n=1 Tax=Steinernema hermaphroditum TaxID=289476 RepID=A0AA39LR06_9BILA|nr:hypothetical protein QR680_018601 [Steinernema hermaphroditum]